MQSEYLIIGGTGSLGKKLIERLCVGHSISVFSRDEAKHWTLRNEFFNSPIIKNLCCYVGDVRDASRVRDVVRQVDPRRIVIASALKHVDTCELSPDESVLTNIVGTQNVIKVVNDGVGTSIECVLLVSTDKACSPVNTYGMCKAISERLVTSQMMSGLQHVKYVAVRYGNVLESRGSIVPLFKYQSEHSDHLTVTDPDMTRFVMTLDESVDLILDTFEQNDSGTISVPILPSMRIGDLATIFSERFGKPIKVVGHRPGEKMHEELINESESRRTTHVGDRYIINPAFMPGTNATFSYTSADTVMRKDELLDRLLRYDIIDRPANMFKGLSIEEIVTEGTN